MKRIKAIAGYILVVILGVYILGVIASSLFFWLASSEYGFFEDFYLSLIWPYSWPKELGWL